MNYQVNTSDLKDQNVADQFYEDRYRDGYMDEWPLWKKERIIEIIQQLNLPASGSALDFGCGRGIFTKVIKLALPNWDVTGCDISQVAMNDAAKKYRDCNFEHLSALHADDRKFDFIFSHHVLEHVVSIEESINDIAKLQIEKGVMLHVLPCGNEGSLEYGLAASLPDGLNTDLGNRFYFEDIGHMRRLSSEQMDNIFENEDYSSHNSWFANHEFGSLEWMSDYPTSFVEESLANKNLAQGDAKLELKLDKFRKRIARLKEARLFAKQGSRHRIKTRLIELKSNASRVFGVFYAILKDLQLVREGEAFNRNLEAEWPNRQKDLSGSEMYLAYKKN